MFAARVGFPFSASRLNGSKIVYDQEPSVLDDAGSLSEVLTRNPERALAESLCLTSVLIADNPTGGDGANVPSNWIDTLRPRVLRALQCFLPALHAFSASGRRWRTPANAPATARGGFIRKRLPRRGLALHLLIPFDFTSQFEFAQRPQFLPTNIFPASLSPLNVHRSQFEATLANSPPPG